MTLGDFIGVAQIILVNKKDSKYHVGILMSQNFQFIKVNLVKINPKTVATLLY